MCIPKHFTDWFVTCIPSTLLYWFLRVPRRMHSVLDKFIFDPASLQKISMVLMACLRESIFFSDNVISSACWMFLISFSEFLTVNPFINPLFFILSDKISATKRYNNAEIGQPCLIPLCI